MTPWDSACLALKLLSVDPASLGGAVLRARVGPARDAFLTAARATGQPWLRLHPSMDLETLTGGIDVAATLGQGRLIEQGGLLAGGPSQILLAMAERCPPLLSSHLAVLLDKGAGHVLLALDEGADPDERPSPALSDRLAFHLTLADVAVGDLRPATPVVPGLSVANVTTPPDTCEMLVQLASDLGISSLRAPSFALAAARAHAALNRHMTIERDDLEAAVSLVYAPRATRLPQQDDQDPPPPPPEDQSPNCDTTENLHLDQDLLLEAVKTALPDHILDQLATGSARKASGTGAGKKRIGNRRGRPLPARDGRPSGAARVDIMATLRAAVPWQTLRRQADPTRIGPQIRASDLRYKRFQQQSDRLLIFAVDASGSAALARLGEAKGAVELLLAEAYARRDHVTLISFRGDAAETLLPPTRSLVQTKRRLAALPGGGGTPLAAGLKAAGEMAEQAAKKGMTPTLVLLTDGRSNIALDGSPDRVQAAADATRIAQVLAGQGIASLVIDTGRRPEQGLKSLSETLCGEYVSLPRADARRLSEAVNDALAG